MTPQTVRMHGYSKQNHAAVAEHVRHLRLVEAQKTKQSIGLIDLVLAPAAISFNLAVGSMRVMTTPARFLMSLMD